MDCITHRNGAIYQYASIGGLHPGRTDMSEGQVVLEAELRQLLQRAGIRVRDVYLPPGGCSNIDYASIKPVGGDAKQALALMLAGSRQWMPKIAYVFDDDIDIRDDERVAWALAWRYNPEKGTLILPGQNMLPLDPSLGVDRPPVSIAKAGFDCTIPVIGNVDRFGYEAATVSKPLAPAPAAPALSEDELVRAMDEFIRTKPRTWKDIIERFAGQPYPTVYRAFGRLRHRLGRIADERPWYPYTFADSEFVYTRAKTRD